MKKTIATCQSCGSEKEINTFPLINIETTPELKDLVKSGSLFAWQCPSCTKTNIANYQTIYHDPQLKLLFWLLPANQIDEDTLNTIEKALKKQFVDNNFAKEDSDYVLRRVESVGELIEKVKIFDSNLDDKVIELCKYVTKLELAEKIKDSDQSNKLMSTLFRFYEINGADNEITLSYPLDNQMQLVKIGFNTYEDSRGILMRNPKMNPTDSFPLINSSWISQNIR